MVPPGAMELVRGTSCKRGTNKKIKIKKCTSAYVIPVLDIPTQYYYMYQVPGTVLVPGSAMLYYIYMDGPPQQKV